MKIKKIISVVMAITLAAGTMSGCGNKVDDGKISFSIGNWPVEGSPWLEAKEANLSEFKEKHPEWNVTTDEYAFDVSTFTAKAAGKQLPTILSIPFTEVDNVVDNGYAADVTDVAKDVGLYDYLNPMLVDVVTRDGKMYGVPKSAYAQGLHMNKKLFKDAGLVNDDGTVKIPNTLEEMAEFAGIIKEKTGQAGFVLPTTNNWGGWHLVNLAWNMGVEFMEKGSDGKYTAKFNSPEFVNILQWVYDMKWKYDALADNPLIDGTECFKLFGTDQGAMVLTSPPRNELISYGMDTYNVAVGRMPEGPGGRYSLLGGEIYMISAEASEEEKKAALTWIIEYGGLNFELSEDVEAKYEKNAKTASEAKTSFIMTKTPMKVINNPEITELYEKVYSKYSNVDMKDYEDYFSFENVEIRPEEPACCQQLYSILDKCIQEIITNKDVDIKSLAETSANDFQKNHLDKM